MSDFLGSEWSSVESSEGSVLLGHIGSLGIVDDIFGVYATPSPQFIRLSLGYLGGFCAMILIVLLIASSICLGDLTSNTIPRVNIAMGCLYRHIDPWYLMVPRMFTCTYLHLNLLHFFMNFSSLAGTFTTLKSTLAHSHHADWVIYWCFPVWCLGALAGSVTTYTRSLGRTGSFTLGASGGACAFSAFVIFYLITQPDLGEDKMSSLITSLAFAVLTLLPLNVAQGARGPKADNDAHRGGFVMGILLAVIVKMLQSRFDSISLKRIAALLSVICATLTAISFLEVFRQYLTGHSDRVTKAYLRWMKIDEIKLKDKPPNELRRWTVAEIQGIDAKINLNVRDQELPNLFDKTNLDEGVIDSLERAEIENLLKRQRASL